MPNYLISFKIVHCSGIVKGSFSDDINSKTKISLTNLSVYDLLLKYLISSSQTDQDFIVIFIHVIFIQQQIKAVCAYATEREKINLFF